MLMHALAGNSLGILANIMTLEDHRINLSLISNRRADLPQGTFGGMLRLASLNSVAAAGERRRGSEIARAFH